MAASGQTPIVSVLDVTVRFGGIAALDGVSFDMDPGRIAGLSGPNRAGKTALFKCLSGLYRPTRERWVLFGELYDAAKG